MRDTKTKKVLEHLKKYSGLTPKQALDRYGVMRLASIVFNLRQQGHPIKSTEVKVKDKFGGTCKVAKYYLEKEA